MNSQWSNDSAPEPMTTWTNPTAHPIAIEVSIPCSIQRSAVDEEGVRRTWVQTSELKAITWAPGEAKAVPQRFDRAIHQVASCDHVGCRRGICRTPALAGPKAAVIAGLAPLLQRAGQKYGIQAGLVVRPEPVRSMATVAPADVAGRLAEPEAPDPTLERARARARAKAAGQ